MYHAKESLVYVEICLVRGKLSTYRSTSHIELILLLVCVVGDDLSLLPGNCSLIANAVNNIVLPHIVQALT